jgi:hypothetical protein
MIEDELYALDVAIAFAEAEAEAEAERDDGKRAEWLRRACLLRRVADSIEENRLK